MICVSVIIPCYNAERFITDCLESVMHQTLLDIEIICVDDGSTDGTNTILYDYAKKDKRITVLQQKNSGAGVARNEGLKIAQGEYLAFLDCDDVFEVTMLDKMYKAAKEEELDIVVCRADRFDNDSKAKKEIRWSIKENLLPLKRPFAGVDIENNFYSAFIWWPWDKLYKKTYIDSLGIEFQALRTTNDLFFVASAVVSAKRINIVQDILVHQRSGLKSSLSVTREKSWDCFYHALVKVKQYLIVNHLYERFQRDFINYALKFSLWHLDTIQGYNHALLYNALRNEWYRELGLLNRELDYFYNNDDFFRLQNILETDLEHHLCQRIEDLLAMNEKLLNEKAKIKKQAARNEKLLKEKVNNKNREEQQIKKSFSYRIGRAITFIPRKVRGVLRLKE